jgi:hypothetical protein
VTGEGGGEQGLVRAQPRVGLRAGDLVERQLARPFHLRRLEARVRDRIREHVQPQLEERGRDHRLEDGLVQARPGAHAPLDRLYLARATAGRAPLAAAQDQVLVKVSGAGQRGGIVGGAGGDPDLDRDQRRDVVLLDDDADAVVEHRVGAHRRRGRRRRGTGDDVAAPTDPTRVPAPARERRGRQHEREHGTGGRQGGHEPGHSLNDRRSLPEGIGRGAPLPQRV